MKDAEGYELETYRIVWYAERGYTDGCGMGEWRSTKFSKPFKTEKEAIDYFQILLCMGELEKMRWGELRPKWSYGITRIRKAMEKINE